MQSQKQLPPEILLLILESCPTPRVLVSLIGSSPLFYRVYVRSKLVIQSKVVKNAFHPALLPIAVLLCEAANEPCLIEIDAELEKLGDATSSTRKETIEKIRQRRTKTFIETDNLMARSSCFNEFESREHYLFIGHLLFRLWIIIDRFIGEFSTHALMRQKEKYTRKCEVGSLATSWVDLSDMEYDRMQRAFLYFELHCRLNQECVLPDTRIYPPILQPFGWADEMLCNLNIYEKAEVWSAYCYLRYRIEDVFENMETNLLASFNRISQQGSGTNDRMEMHKYKNLDPASLSIVGKFRKGGERIDAFVNFGLTFCFVYLKLSVEEQISVARRHYSYLTMEFLERNIERALNVGHEHEYGPLQANDSRILPERMKSHEVHHELKARLGNQECGLDGFFFWDQNRMDLINHDLDVDWKPTCVDLIGNSHDLDKRTNEWKQPPEVFDFDHGEGGGIPQNQRKTHHGSRSKNIRRMLFNRFRKKITPSDNREGAMDKVLRDTNDAAIYHKFENDLHLGQSHGLDRAFVINRDWP